MADVAVAPAAPGALGVAGRKTVGAVRELGEIFLFFGLAVGAKVGCGLAAELGTMRISQEIDALETLGVNTIHYLVSTRILACLIVLPLLHVAALTSGFIASYVVQIFQIHQLSQGIYLDYFWRFMNL